MTATQYEHVDSTMKMAIARMERKARLAREMADEEMARLKPNYSLWHRNDAAADAYEEAAQILLEELGVVKDTLSAQVARIVISYKEAAQ